MAPTSTTTQTAADPYNCSSATVYCWVVCTHLSGAECDTSSIVSYSSADNGWSIPATSPLRQRVDQRPSAGDDGRLNYLNTSTGDKAANASFSPTKSAGAQIFTDTTDWVLKGGNTWFSATDAIQLTVNGKVVDYGGASGNYDLQLG